jgi:Protein of unknown function DUF86
MRRDDLYLNDIVEAADHISAFVVQTDFEGFRQSELVRSAVVQKLAIIGEAAARISEELKCRYPSLALSVSSPEKAGGGGPIPSPGRLVFNQLRALENRVSFSFIPKNLVRRDLPLG